MKSKAQHQFLATIVLATLLVAGSFWAKISMESHAQPAENQFVTGKSAVDAARQILSTLPRRTSKKPFLVCQ